MTEDLPVVKRAYSVAVPLPSPSLSIVSSIAPRSISLSGPSGRSNTSIHSPTPRRLNRKLPPELTESLLALESASNSGTPTTESHHTFQQTSPESEQEMGYPYRRPSDSDGSIRSTHTLTPSTTSWKPSAEFARYTLVVDPPTDGTCTVYEPKPPKRVVALHQIKVESHIVDATRSPSLESEATTIEDLYSPLSPAYSRIARTPSPSLFKSNWPSRRPQTPVPAPAPAPEIAPPSLISDSTASSSGWSALRELEARERAGRLKPKVKETRKEKKSRRKEKKSRRKAEKENFSSEAPPGLRDLFNASLCEVLDEHGNKTQFGDLVSGKRTIVVFIRHWFCPLCAQYMNSILSNVPPSALEEADVDLIIIGNGSHKMLNGYKNKSFKCPFKMYTDPSLKLYRALGLTRQTGDAGPDSEAGSYLTQTPLEATMQTIKRATKMPLLHSPGHFTQIGGEFVFDGSLNVIYTHRMKNTRDHSPIEDVCAAAGLRLEYIHYEPGPLPPPVHMRSTEVVNEWVTERDEVLEEMRRKKELRRGGGSGDTVKTLTTRMDGLEVSVESRIAI